MVLLHSLRISSGNAGSTMQLASMAIDVTMSNIQLTTGKNRGHSITRIAVDYPAWCLGVTTNTNFTNRCLKSFRAAELLLVVGDHPEAVDLGRDTTFVTPSECPEKFHNITESKTVRLCAENRGIDASNFKWEELADMVEESLQKARDHQLGKIKRLKDRTYKFIDRHELNLY